MAGTPTGTISNISSGNAADATYLGGAELYATATTGSSSWNCGSFTMPSAGLMVALFTGRDAANTTITGATMGGSAATFYTLMFVGSVDRMCLACKQVSSGSNNVTWTANAAIGGNDTVFSCSVWYVFGHNNDVPYLTLASNPGANTTYSNTMTIAPNAVTLFQTWLYGATAGYVWTGDSITVDNPFNQIGAGPSRFWSAGHLRNATSGLITNTVGASWTTSGANQGLAISFQ